MTGGRGALLRRLAQAYGLSRSLWIYWANPLQLRRMRRFYAAFVREGDLCFDLGAHVGTRSFIFRRLGARVVAVEPQPLFGSFLAWLFRNSSGVTVLPVAVGNAWGTVELILSAATPTVTTASAGFLEAVATVPSFAWVRWDERVVVPVVTLDQLIARYGRPAFVKIDVEGMEAEVLDGLSEPVRALSFEFIPAHKAAAARCLARLEALGRFRYNVSLGESMQFVFADWCDAGVMGDWLKARAAQGPSGDVYAVLEGAS